MQRSDSEKFAQVSKAVILDNSLRHSEFRLYSLLRSWAWQKDGDKTWVGQDRLAAEMGCSVKTVQRGIEKLEARGYITVRRRGKRVTNLMYVPRNPDDIRADATAESVHPSSEDASRGDSEATTVSGHSGGEETAVSVHSEGVTRHQCPPMHMQQDVKTLDAGTDHQKQQAVQPQPAAAEGSDSNENVNGERLGQDGGDTTADGTNHDASAVIEHDNGDTTVTAARVPHDEQQSFVRPQPAIEPSDSGEEGRHPQTLDYTAIYDTIACTHAKWKPNECHDLADVVWRCVDDENTKVTLGEAIHMLRQNPPDEGNRGNPTSYKNHFLGHIRRAKKNLHRFDLSHPLIRPDRFPALHAMIQETKWTDEEKQELYSHVAWKLMQEDLSEESGISALSIIPCTEFRTLNNYLRAQNVAPAEGEGRYVWLYTCISESAADLCATAAGD
jgi:biotin operon repressor